MAEKSRTQWGLQIMGTFFGVVIIGVGGWAFGLSYSTHEDLATHLRIDSEGEAAHNINPSAHPSMVGKLNMIEEDVHANKVVLDKVHEEQIKQGVILDSIQKSVNGD